MKAKKTERRIQILDQLVSALTNSEIYETIKYKSKNEDQIKSFIYQPLLKAVEKLFHTHCGLSPEKAKQQARTALAWEGDQKTTVHNFMFFGVQHRPDFDLNFDELKIAIEVKRGENGQAVREGIGQSIVYTTQYHFCIFLFIDTSADKKISNAFTSDNEAAFVESLWLTHNVMFRVA